MPQSQVNDLTQTSKVRQKILYRAENGIPLHKAVHNNDFVPPSCPGAKDGISSKNFGLFDDHYDSKVEHEYHTNKMQKKKELHGHFKRANYFDNGTKVD